MKRIQMSTTYPPPILQFPAVQHQDFRSFIPKKVQTYEFYTLSDGQKRIYTDGDGLKGYGQQKIQDPKKVSYINLFINGVLQPNLIYEVQEGKIIIHTQDVPPKGAPIILQMVKI